MTQEQGGLGQQALNIAAEIGIASQLNEVENIAVDVRTDPLKIAQGEVDSLAISGDGVVLLEDLRLEQLDLQTGSITIDLLGAIFGKVELTQPADATARAVLTEADINRALNSAYVRDWLRRQDVHVWGQTLMIDLQQVQCRLPSDTKITLTADFLLRTATKTYPVVLSILLAITDNGEYVSLLQSAYAEGKDLPIELTAALLTKLSEVLKLRYFEQKDLSLLIQQLNVEAGKVILQGRVHVDRFPLQ